MDLEFPYQLVTFLDKEPQIGEPVYYGENGWYPQLALKRRFKLEAISEEAFIGDLKQFIDAQMLAPIATGRLVKPERMPVRVIDIKNQDGSKKFHDNFLKTFGPQIVSRYPDREGENYYAHITAEYNDRFVISVEQFENKVFAFNNVWLLKDVVDENSIAYMKIL